MMLLFGCYTRRKAEKQVNFAAVTFPDILAKKARDLFPCVTKGGDTIWVSDSAEYKQVLQLINDENLKLYVEKDSLDKALKDAIADTACFAIVKMYQVALAGRDKVIEKYAYQLAHPPVITNTAIIHDTTVDNAAVEACEMDKAELSKSLDKKTEENNGWKTKAKTRNWMNISGWLAILLLLFLLFKRKRIA